MKYEKNQLNRSCGCEKQPTDIKSSLSSSENDTSFTTFQNYESLCGPESNTINSRQPRSASLADVNTKLSGPDVVVPQYKNGEYSVLPYNYNDWPTVENGILTFRDYDHFDNYCQFLENMSDKLFEGDSKQEFYDKVEGNIGFISLRRITEEKFNEEALIGWQRIEDVPYKNFINSMLFKSFLNQNAEVKIGNLITKFINRTVVITVTASNLNLLSMIRQFPQNITKEEVLKIENQFQNDFYVEDYNSTIENETLNNLNTFESNSIKIDNKFYSNDVSIISTDSINGIKGTGKVEDTIIKEHYNEIGTGHSLPYMRGASYFIDKTKLKVNAIDECVEPYTVKVENIRLKLGNPKGSQKADVGDAVYRIYWDTDPIPQVIRSSTGIAWVKHKFNSGGRKKITINASTPDALLRLAISAQTELIVVLGCNKGKSKSSPWHYKLRPSDGNRVVKGRHWVEQWNTWGGSGRQRSSIGMESYALHWERNNKNEWAYRPYKKGILRHEVWITRFNGDDCTIKDYFFQYEHAIKAKDHLHSEYFGDGFWGWNGITTRHRLYTLDDGQAPTELTFTTPAC